MSLHCTPPQAGSLSVDPCINHDDVRSSFVPLPEVKQALPGMHPFAYLPSDLVYRLFEDLVPLKTPRAPLFCLSKTSVFFQKAVRTFLDDHPSGQTIKRDLQAFAPLQPFSEIFIRKRSNKLNLTLIQHQRTERDQQASFKASAVEDPTEVASAIEWHEPGLRHPLRLLWPMEGGWATSQIKKSLQLCKGKVLNLVFNDTLRDTLVDEMFPSLWACAPGSSVILELRRTELDDELLTLLGRVCQEHPVIYQISLQSWQPADSASLSAFLVSLMCMPTAVRVIDMNYGIPITDDVALAIIKALPDLHQTIELRFATKDLSESLMKVLIESALTKNAEQGVQFRLELHVGEDFCRPNYLNRGSHYLDVHVRSQMKAKGVSFCKVRGISEEKNPDFLSEL